MRSVGGGVCGHTCVRGGTGPPWVAEPPACSTTKLATFWEQHLSASAGQTLSIHRLKSPEHLLINLLMRELRPCNHWV